MKSSSESMEKIGLVWRGFGGVISRSVDTGWDSLNITSLKCNHPPLVSPHHLSCSHYRHHLPLPGLVVGQSQQQRRILIVNWAKLSDWAKYRAAAGSWLCKQFPTETKTDNTDREIWLGENRKLRIPRDKRKVALIENGVSNPIIFHQTVTRSLILSPISSLQHLLIIRCSSSPPQLFVCLDNSDQVWLG